MQRHRPAEPVRRHHVRRVDLVDVDEAEAPRDREVRRLAGLVARALEHGPAAAHERVDVGAGGDAEEGVAEAVALADRVALDQAVAVERREQPPGRAPVEPAGGGELVHGRAVRAVRDRLDQRRGAVDRLDRLRARLGRRSSTGTSSPSGASSTTSRRNGTASPCGVAVELLGVAAAVPDGGRDRARARRRRRSRVAPSSRASASFGSRAVTRTRPSSGSSRSRAGVDVDDARDAALDRGERVRGRELDARLDEPAVDPLVLHRVHAPLRDARRGRDERHALPLGGEQLREDAAEVVVVVVEEEDPLAGGPAAGHQVVGRQRLDGGVEGGRPSCASGRRRRRASARRSRPRRGRSRSRAPRRRSTSLSSATSTFGSFASWPRR